MLLSSEGRARELKKKDKREEEQKGTPGRGVVRSSGEKEKERRRWEHREQDVDGVAD